MVGNSNYQSITCLYRSLLRQAHRLPHEYLRQFFGIRVKESVQNALRSRKGVMKAAKLKRARKELKRLQLANAGDSKAFSRVLDLAYGRIGPLRHAIMKPLLSPGIDMLPPKLVPSVERSRPPVYSPELSALLASNHARRTGKAISSAQTRSPPILPARADLSSEQARIFGPFSKRREVNIRWRYFTSNWKSLYPPLEVCVRRSQTTRPSVDLEALGAANIRPVGLQGANVLEELVTLGGSVSSPPMPRRHRRMPSMTFAARPESDANVPTLPVAPTRFLRRRYRELIGRVPVLTYSLSDLEKNPLSRGTYGISLVNTAITHKARNTIEESTEANDVDMTWVDLYSTRRMP
ncbi:hypothetical protein OF83DRAFT_1080105 [Amylostereum chailletii]|nr:hypothetical protein OF83DRAFT_1080105 [Amylostereum chailletii]